MHHNDHGQLERLRAIGKQLDALGPEYRLSPEKQARAEELLEKKKLGLLDRAERRELNAILREADEIMLRRAEALDRIPGACPPAVTMLQIRRSCDERSL